MNGFCHIEICTTDPGASRDFLGPLLEWDFQEMGPDYALISTGDGPGGGLMRVDAPRGIGDIAAYVHVASIDETLSKALELGGKVETEKTEIGGGHGYFAMLGIPGGAVLGLWQAREE